jgi:hypothetical protein
MVAIAIGASFWVEMVFHMNLSVASTQPTNYLLQVEIKQLDTFYLMQSLKSAEL